MRLFGPPLLGAFLLAFLIPAAAPAQPVVELRPSARFDAAPFSSLRGLVALRDGSVVVVDPIEGGLFRVDLERGVREPVGREGAGPDEYDAPTGIGPWRGDSILVTDLRNARLAVLDGDLRMGRTLPMSGPGYSIPRASDREGGLFFDLNARVRVQRQRDGSRRELAPVVRWDTRAGQGDTLGHIAVPIGASAGPFPQRDEWGVGPDGRVAIVRNREVYRLDWVLPDGVVVEGPVIDEERLPVTDRDRELWLEGNGGGGGGSIGVPGGAARSSVSFPDHLPRVRWRGVYVDGQGRAWVVRHQPLEDRRPLLDVFDAGGERVGRVRLPEGREIVAVAGGALWAVRVDEVDFEWLERYELPDFG